MLGIGLNIANVKLKLQPLPLSFPVDNSTYDEELDLGTVYT